MGVIDTAGAECLETCTLGTVEGKSLKDLPIPTNGILLYRTHLRSSLQP